MDPDPKLRAALEPSWNDVREQRVLGRIIEARKQRSARWPLALRLAAMTGALAAAGVLTWVVARPRGLPIGVTSVTSTAPAASADPHPSTLTLADGSEAILGPDGNVEVEEQAPARVALRQRAGSARYVVKPDPSRAFEVHAEGVAVRVRGTIFTVTVHPETVEVSVERGRVEVAAGSRTRDLVAGEAFTAPLHPPAEDATEKPAAPSAPAPAAAPASASPPSAATLLARADEARAAGRSSEAAQALEAFVATYPHDARMPAALFTLGKVDRSRGRPESAAADFERCARAAPGGPLEDDALSEAALAWNAAGNADRAAAAATSSLDSHPRGLHAAAMRAILGK